MWVEFAAQLSAAHFTKYGRVWNSHEDWVSAGIEARGFTMLWNFTHDTSLMRSLHAPQKTASGFSTLNQGSGVLDYGIWPPLVFFRSPRGIKNLA